MSFDYAILIDGGFLKSKLATPKSPANAGDIHAFAERIRHHPLLADKRLYRIFFYDAAPLETTATKPLGGAPIDFGSTDTATRNKVLHRDLSRLPCFAFRFGELVHRGWQIRPRKLKTDGTQVCISCDDLMANIQQKGVDMRIGLDIASLTLKHQVEIIILVTGDSDFVPAMKFARREGAQLYLVTLANGVREPMLEHTDLLLDIPAG